LYWKKGGVLQAPGCLVHFLMSSERAGVGENKKKAGNPLIEVGDASGPIFVGVDKIRMTGRV